jgi:arabinan endo-1,5-alpha-L-arabinosidase
MEARIRKRIPAFAVALLAGLAALAGSGELPAAAAAGAPQIVPVPVLQTSFPDPGVTYYDHEYYGFGTGAGLRESEAPTAAGPWSVPVDELVQSSLPSWVQTGLGMWAPDMIKAADGKFVVYFAAPLEGADGPVGVSDSEPAAGARCIATAESTSPTGPFTANPSPLVCLEGYGAADDMTAQPGDRVLGEGAIDPDTDFVRIDGRLRLYLVYKTQAPDNGQSTIRMVQLSPADGTTVIGTSRQLLVPPVTTSFNDTIEGPSLVQNGAWFTLFVAHGNYGSCDYSTRYYTSTNIWKWNNRAAKVLLDAANTGLCGPGGAQVSNSPVPGQYYLFFHGWTAPGSNTVPATPANVGDSGATREMYAAKLAFGPHGTPRITRFLTPPTTTVTSGSAEDTRIGGVEAWSSRHLTCTSEHPRTGDQMMGSDF